MLAENHALRQLRQRYQCEGFEEVSCSELIFLPFLVDFLHICCLCYLDPKNQKQKKSLWPLRPQTNSTLTKAIEQWRQTFAKGTSARALFDDEFKTAVGEFGALTVARSRRARNSTGRPSTRPALSTQTKVTNSAPREALHGYVGADSGSFQSSGRVHNDALGRDIRGRVCGASLASWDVATFFGPMHDLQGESR